MIFLAFLYQLSLQNKTEIVHTISSQHETQFLVVSPRELRMALA